jgi:hypothetical protein
MIFEVCAMLAAMVALTGLFHRLLLPRLLRLAGAPLLPANAPAAGVTRARLARSRLGSPA